MSVPTNSIWPWKLGFSSLILLLSTNSGASEETPAGVGGKGQTVQFEPYKATESYKCGHFIESSINDPAMRLFHSASNALIRQLSQPFPHEKLLDSDALLGRPEAWRNSFEQNHQQWIEFEKYWLALAAAIVFFPAVFTLLYLLYRCCSCCCRRGKKSRHTDKKFDSCLRVIWNTVLAFFVFVNVFAAVVLLINTQYAQYNIEELPTRLHYCVNDFSVYKIETSERIKKLLRDDFHALNQTLVGNFNGVGENVLLKFKKSTGLNLVDDLLVKTRKAEPIRQNFLVVERELKQLQTSKTFLLNKFAKLKESEDELQKCQTVPNAAKSSICDSTLQLIRPLLNIDADWSQNDILPEGISENLQKIAELSMEQKFTKSTEEMHSLQATIQDFVDSKQGDAVDRLKSLDDTMFRLYEEISSSIKGVDLRFLDELIDPMMQNRENFKVYVQYSWVISLIMAGIFVFIAISFLLGLFYGCCGRRPNYHNDDCCVKTTGGKFYSCGIWTCLAFMTFFALITAVLLLIGANVSNLVCLPMHDPLSRPDMLSLLDRLAEAYGFNENAKQDVQRHIPQLFTGEKRPVDIIKGCSRGDTFYTMFGLDKKFKLLNDGGPKDEYQDLSNAIKSFSAGKSYRFNNVISVYNSEIEAALQALGQIQLPLIKQSAIEQLRSSIPHFEINDLLHQLKKNYAEKSDQPPIHEVDVVLKYLEDLKPSSQTFIGQLKEAISKLEKMKEDLDGMQFNTTETISQLQHTNTLLAADQLSDRLYTAANEVVVEDLAGNIEKYAQHVNHSMMTEVSSCLPIKEIARNTRTALCDYTLDYANGVWMSMAISLLLMIPIIALSTTLSRLYGRIHPFPKYIINEPSSGNDATFATDTIYDGSGLESRRFKPSQFSSSPYSMSNNYGYNEDAVGGYYPPPYATRS